MNDVVLGTNNDHDREKYGYYTASTKYAIFMSANTRKGDVLGCSLLGMLGDHTRTAWESSMQDKSRSSGQKDILSAQYRRQYVRIEGDDGRELNKAERNREEDDVGQEVTDKGFEPDKTEKCRRTRRRRDRTRNVNRKFDWPEPEWREIDSCCTLPDGTAYHTLPVLQDLST